MPKPKTFAGFIGKLDIWELSQKSQILLVASFMRSTGRIDFSKSELTKEFKTASLPPLNSLTTRLSQLTKGTRAPLLRVQPGRYSLSLYGVQEVDAYLGVKPGTGKATGQLEALVARLGDKGRRRFLAEAVACLEVGAKRAAVVMTWILAFDHLSEFIIQHKLADFNAAGAKRKGFAAITDRDELAELKEFDVIEVARSAGIVSKDVSKILHEKLGIRNTCAHPSDIEVHDTKVINVVEDLVDNVILKYPL